MDITATESIHQLVQSALRNAATHDLPPDQIPGYVIRHVEKFVQHLRSDHPDLYDQFAIALEQELASDGDEEAALGAVRAAIEQRRHR